MGSVVQRNLPDEIEMDIACACELRKILFPKFSARPVLDLAQAVATL